MSFSIFFFLQNITKWYWQQFILPQPVSLLGFLQVEVHTQEQRFFTWDPVSPSLGVHSWASQEGQTPCAAHPLTCCAMYTLGWGSAGWPRTWLQTREQAARWAKTELTNCTICWKSKWWNWRMTSFAKLWRLQQFRMLGMISTDSEDFFFFWSFCLATAFLQPLILSYFWANLSVQLILRSNLDVVHSNHWELLMFSIFDAWNCSCLVCGSFLRWTTWNTMKFNVTPISCVIVCYCFSHTLFKV